MESQLMKRALIRDTETPIGFPGKMHINCGCGQAVEISHPFDRDWRVTCVCGVTYDGAGWIILPDECQHYEHFNSAQGRYVCPRKAS